MVLCKSYSEGYYFFTNYINKKICKNLLKFNNIVIVYNQNRIVNPEKFLKIKKFCKYNNLKLYILDNLQLAQKFNLDGLILSHNNYKVSYLISAISKKKHFTITGKVHNQREYYFKKKQNCQNIILSPLFKNKKYKNSQLLGIIKFNLLSLSWKENIFALGGINLFNLKKMQMTKIKGCAFSSFLKTNEIKNPFSYFIKRTG